MNWSRGAPVLSKRDLNCTNATRWRAFGCCSVFSLRCVWNAAGRACTGLLPAGIFAETGATTEDTEGLVDYARSIDGVDIGALIEERPDGTTKASLRAKDPIYRLDLVAAQFNGGGHACAAGLNFKGKAVDFYPRLVAALAEQLAAVGGKSKD